MNSRQPATISPQPAVLLCLAVLIAAGLSSGAKAADTLLPEASKHAVDFGRDVLPILQTHCFDCHEGAEPESDVRLDVRDNLLGKLDGRALVVVGHSAESRLIQLAAGAVDDKVMPPKDEGQRLSNDQIAVLRRWIDDGLAWDEQLLPPPATNMTHWAFQPLARPDVPQVERSEWDRNPIDAFVAARHQEKGLAPAPAAAPRTLIRRMSLDLLGLPPTPDEVDAFENESIRHRGTRNRGSSAIRNLVDRLLDSPHYGERWGRHWLDVARWAESEGYESNHPRPFAWRYRDYVIDSFNTDRPFDEFVLQQLAGDELAPYSDENLIATGFLAAARISSNEEDKWLQRNDTNVDIVNAVGSAFMGLTIHCAQCHNHKFDPITARDYYRLQAFFIKGQPVDVALHEPRHRADYEARRPAEYEPALALKQAIFERARERLIAEAREKMSQAELTALDTPADRRTIEQELLARRADLSFQSTPNGIEKHIPEADRELYNSLKKKIAEIEKTCPLQPQTFAFYSPVTSPHKLTVLPSIGFYPLPFDAEAFRRARPYLMIRGDVHGIGPYLQPGWPQVFGETPRPTGREGTGDLPYKTRTQLARWLTDPVHGIGGLTARVWVNRIWHYHFGRGIVATPGDFGLRGAPPTHPKLLDWLASELIESGWSTKHIHRLILTSNTYQQSAVPLVAKQRQAEADPDNEFLWHWQPRRLEAETIRDAMLAVSDELDRTAGGASVPIDEREASVRRSLYLFQKRGVATEVLSLFDGPVEASESCGLRHVSTTPLQSLYLLNGRFVLDRAKALAAEVREAGDRRAQIEAAFLRVLGRRPEAEEITASEKILAMDSEEQPLALFCQALLNTSEFVYLE